LGQPKNKWTNLTVDDLRKDPALQDELFELIENAYRPIGGHIKLRKPVDLLGGEVVLFETSDVDSDPEPDAVNLIDTKPAGEKYVGTGHDDTPAGKKAALGEMGKNLKSSGIFAEVSGAPAHVLITRYKVPTVDDEESVRKALKGKKIEWVGAHPKGKYPNNLGWYYRDFAGKKFLKILVGRPKV
jgi:hypothetical protein